MKDKNSAILETCFDPCKLVTSLEKFRDVGICKKSNVHIKRVRMGFATIAVKKDCNFPLLFSKKSGQKLEHIFFPGKFGKDLYKLQLGMLPTPFTR